MQIGGRPTRNSDRGREGFCTSPPSEPYGRFSRIRLSSRWFPHRDCLAFRQAASVVNSSGGREEFVWPAYPVFLAVAATRSFLLLAQHRPKPPSRERVDVLETRGRVLEVVVPPFEHRIERGDHAGEALSARPSRLRSDLVPQAQHALLPHEPASRLETISQELEPPAR